MITNRLLLLGPEFPEVTQLKDDFTKKNYQVELETADDFDTAHAYLMTNAPMVIMSTDILLILKLLMKEKEYIKKTSTKTILFNNRGPLPKDVEGKLTRCGLTGELTEESSSKTIYYKTTLYLKSLPSQEEVNDILYDGKSSYIPPEKRKVTYIKEVKKNEDGEVELETEKGLIDNTVLNEFCDESENILKEMEKIIEGIEDEEIAFDQLPKFSDLVNGIMGTSSVLGLDGISTFCQLTKYISETVMLYSQQDLRDIVVGVLGDATSFLLTLLEDVREGDESNLKNIGKEGLVKRLQWLSDKFAKPQEEAAGKEVMDQASIDDLLNSLLP